MPKVEVEHQVGELASLIAAMAEVSELAPVIAAVADVEHQRRSKA